MSNTCIECEWYEIDTNNLCHYCYTKSQVVLENENEIAEVCRKCDKGYKYTLEEVDMEDVGEDICRNCVRVRKQLRNMNFTLDDLKGMLRQLNFEK